MTGTGQARRALRLALAGAVLAALWLGSPGFAPAAVSVVTTSPALADLAREVGGEGATVEALMRGPENPHNVVPTPSLVMKLRKADLFVHLGLDAEPWVPGLLRAARRSRLLPGGPGNVDASRGIELRDVPRRNELSRALGDVHVYGNTHYMLDPRNGSVVAATIADALSRVDPERRDRWARNLADLESRLAALRDRLRQKMSAHRGAPVVTYHRTWPYFLDFLSLESLAEVEPKPGIPPGPQHVAALAARMKQRGVRVVIVETFSSRQIAERVARRGGARAVVLAQEVHALPGVDSYARLFEHNVEQLLRALEAPEGGP